MQHKCSAKLWLSTSQPRHDQMLFLPYTHSCSAGQAPQQAPLRKTATGPHDEQDLLPVPPCATVLPGRYLRGAHPDTVRDACCLSQRKSDIIFIRRYLYIAFAIKAFTDLYHRVYECYIVPTIKTSSY